MLKCFSAAKKLYSQNWSSKWRFFENSQRGPQKAFPYPEWRYTSLRILRKHPFEGVSFSLIEKRNKTSKKLVTREGQQNHVFGKQKPLNR